MTTGHRRHRDLRLILAGGAVLVAADLAVQVVWAMRWLLLAAAGVMALEQPLVSDRLEPDHHGVSADVHLHGATLPRDRRGCPQTGPCCDGLPHQTGYRI
jgi:hypothetical protein